MGRTYKWLGGIGYILMLIPYANFIGAILAAIAWIMMGSETRQGIFKATGILLILSMIVSGALALLIPMSIPGILGGAAALPRLLTGLFAFIGLLIAIIAVIAIIALIVFILELVSHFRAAGIFYIKWFKWAAWMRIIAIITAVIAVTAVFAMAPGLLSASMHGALGQGIFEMLMTVLWPLLIAVIFGVLASIFSAIAFFSIPSEEAYQPSQHQGAPQYPPPPPPTY